MNGLIGRSGLAVALLAIAAVGSTGAALAGDNCSEYAKMTLQQAKENVERRCNFSGDRWSLDPERHRAWCKDVGPTGWRAELKARNEMLSTQCNK